MIKPYNTILNVFNPACPSPQNTYWLNADDCAAELEAGTYITTFAKMNKTIPVYFGHTPDFIVGTDISLKSISIVHKSIFAKSSTSFWVKYEDKTATVRLELTFVDNRTLAHPDAEWHIDYNYSYNYKYLKP
jgi:hypothetical protein